MLLAACIGVGIWLALNIAFVVVGLRKPDSALTSELSGIASRPNRKSRLRGSRRARPGNTARLP